MPIRLKNTQKPTVITALLLVAEVDLCPVVVAFFD